MVVPRMGAMIPVKMKTMTGNPMMLIVRDENKEFLPIGTDLLDADGVSQSIVGQGGMAFIRGWDPVSQLLTATLMVVKINVSLNLMRKSILLQRQRK